MGRGNNSKGLRKAKRQMERGRIHGTNLAEKGKRVTPRDIKTRRELNIQIALSGDTINLQDFEQKRVSWASQTDYFRKTELMKSVRQMEEALVEE